jgi:O-antigen/teichoic acid export membrane protein
MLGQMVGDTEVGHFSVAMRLIEAFGFIPMIIVNSAAPSVTAAKRQDEVAYRARLTNIYRLMFIFFVATALPIMIFSKSIVVLFFGQGYAASGGLLALFSVRLFFTNFGVAKSLFVTNEGLFGYSLASAIAGAIVNVVLNLFLIPRYASVGALWATMASFLTTTFLMDLLWAKTLVNLRLMIAGIVTPHRLRFR